MEGKGAAVTLKKEMGDDMQTRKTARHRARSDRQTEGQRDKGQKRRHTRKEETRKKRKKRLAEQD